MSMHFTLSLNHQYVSPSSTYTSNIELTSIFTIAERFVKCDVDGYSDIGIHVYIDTATQSLPR
uniref:Uncharacterized protein n=1 Tax=Arion vulgaris TaxID=1028688 RepID=A0A0B7BEJ6_9EUPU